MKFKEQDYLEVEEVHEILNRTNRLGQEDMERICDRMVSYQPFMMSLLLGYQVDLPKDAFEDVFKIVLAIYLYFERLFDLTTYQILERDFEEHHNINIAFLKYLEGESDKENILLLEEKDLSKIQSKALLTGVIMMLNEQTGCKRMNDEQKGIIYIGMKSLIECLEQKLVRKE